MSPRSVVVIGGGLGGVVAARRLRRRLDPADRVVMVERSPTQFFQPSLLWVMTGARRPERITSDARQQRRRGIEVVEAEALGLDLDGRTVKTTDGALQYDRAVLAVGAELAPEALAGFADAAHNLYSVEGAMSARDVVRRFDEGRIVVLVSRMPYKCPAAPYEAALLAEAMTRKLGVRQRVTIDIYTPEPQPMPVAGPEVGAAVAAMLEQRGIGFHSNRSVDEVDADGRELILDQGERVGFDLLLGVPPHRAPAVARESGLAAESGYVPVDPHTLETSHPGVYAIGDVTQVPIAGGKFLPKAGVFAHGEAEVVARRIDGELRDRVPGDTFDGHGSCFLETGDGVAAYSTGDFYAEGAPRVTLRPPSRRWHLAKIAFEQYWLRRWS